MTATKCIKACRHAFHSIHQRKKTIEIKQWWLKWIFNLRVLQRPPLLLAPLKKKLFFFPLRKIMCVLGFINRNGYKKNSYSLQNAHIYRLGTTSKFKATGTGTNLPGRGPMLILPSCTARRMIKEGKKSQRITV